MPVSLLLSIYLPPWLFFYGGEDRGIGRQVPAIPMPTTARLCQTLDTFMDMGLPITRIFERREQGENRSRQPPNRDVCLSLGCLKARQETMTNFTALLGYGQVRGRVRVRVMVRIRVSVRVTV
jgi:hypothetical protein